MLALIIPADGTQPIARDAVPEQDVAGWLSAKVEGPVGSLRLADGRDMWVNREMWVNRGMWINGESEANAMPLNIAATMLAHHNGMNEQIAGTVVILGSRDNSTVGLDRAQFTTTWVELHTDMTILLPG